MSNPNDFVIANGELRNYTGAGGNVIIPDSVTKIGDYAFSRRKGLTSITIPDSVTKIGGGAFQSCTRLTSITIPDSVTEIGFMAFYGCSGLKNVTIPDSVTSIGTSAFRYCTGLADKDGFIVVRGVLYGYCGSESDIVIPDSVAAIGHSAFSGCKSLKNIIIPGSVTTIDHRAFSSCNSLTSITIPDSVTEIGNDVFIGCDSAIITLCGTIIPDYHWFVSAASKKPKCRIYCPKIHISDLPLPLKFSAAAGFVEKHDDAVEEDIKKEYTVYFKKQRKMYYSLFGEDPVLLRFFTENRLIPVNEVSQLIESATDVETKAVLLEYSNSFSEEEKTKISKKQEKQQQDEFEKAVGLKALTAADYKKMFIIRTNGDKIKIDGYRSPNPNVVIPEHIGKKKVTIIGSSAFSHRADLIRITIPDSVTDIGFCALNRCTGLTSIIIPDSVTKIEDRAFYGCTGIKDVYYTGTEEQWKKIIIGQENEPIKKANIHFNWVK